MKTLEDLLAAPETVLKDGVTVRLGIEDKSMSRYGVLCLYCLATGFKPKVVDPDHDTWDWGTDECGPVFVSLDDGHNKNVRGRWVPINDPPPIGRTNLFVMPIMAASAGEIRVVVSSGTGERLGRALIKVRSHGAHPWIPFEPQNRTSGRRRPWLGMAVPYWPAVLWTPIAAEEGTILHGRGRRDLPSLVPKAVDPQIKLSVDKQVMKIQTDQEFWVNCPHWYALTRWWINGRPFIPQNPREYPVGNQWIPLTPGKAFETELDLGPLGVKKGDRVGLQVLWSQAGWTWVSDAYQDTYVFSSGGAPGGWAFPRLSNRVEFVVEGGSSGKSTD